MAGFTKYELFKFEKFMDTNKTFQIFTMSTSFSTIAWRKAKISFWQFTQRKHFIRMETHKGYFCSGNEPIAVLSHIIVVNIGRQMPRAIEIYFPDNRWRNNKIEILLGKKIQSIIPNSKTKSGSISYQIIPSETMNFGPSFNVKHFELGHYFNMVFWFKIEDCLISPCLYHYIVSFIFSFWYRHVGNIRNLKH